MIDFDRQHKALLKRIISEGVDVEDRTGTGCRKVFDANITVDLSGDEENYHLPIMSLRKTFPRTAFMELLWMLSGSTDVKDLQEVGVGIWDANSSREFLDKQGLHHLTEGQIGKGYGYQMRKFNGHVDQITNLIEGIKKNPNGRRHIVSMWNPAELHETSLPPCHHCYNFMVVGDKLHLKFTQRSSDQVLAGNMNIMFASFFLMLVAAKTGYEAGKVSQSITDAHIYHNLMDAALEIIERPYVDLEWKMNKDLVALELGTWDINQGVRGVSQLEHSAHYFPCKGLWNILYYSHEINQANEEQVHPPIPKNMMKISA